MTEQEKAIIRQMADYIEKGAEGKQQITGRYVSDDGTGCCALGALMIGAKLKPTAVNAYKIIKEQGYTVPRVIYPSEIKTPWLPDSGKVRIDDAIFQLNDYAGWRFDQIVSWLRSIAE